MKHTSKIAFEYVNLMDRVTDVRRTLVPRATMITVTTDRTDDWRKARIVDFSRRMNDR